MNLEDIGRKTIKAVIAAVSTIVLFIAHSADDAAKAVYRELPDSATVRKEAAEAGELGIKAAKKALGKIAKEEGKELYKEGKKKLDEYQNRSDPQPINPYPYSMGKRPLTDEEKRMNQQLYRNWEALQSANSNQQSSAKGTK